MSFVVLTCARPGPEPYPYLDATLAELPGGLVLVDNSESEVSPAYRPDWLIHHFMRSSGTFHGNKLAYWRCLELALETSGNEAIILEDDLELCRNAARRMALLPVPDDLDWLQFFGPHVLTGPRMFPGIWRPPPAAPAMFTQAIKYKRATLERLIAWQDSPAFLQFTASDQALDLARVSLGLRYGVHAPELVQHVGDISAAEADADLQRGIVPRVSRNYSRDFDAMKLFMRDELYR